MKTLFSAACDQPFIRFSAQGGFIVIKHYGIDFLAVYIEQTSGALQPEVMLMKPLSNLGEGEVLNKHFNSIPEHPL